MICPFCKHGELFHVTHADGMRSWRCKHCGKLLLEKYWEVKGGELVERDKP